MVALRRAYVCKRVSLRAHVDCNETPTATGAAVQQVGAIVMETVSALTVVPAREVDTVGVVVTLNQALCTLVDIWGQK